MADLGRGVELGAVGTCRAQGKMLEIRQGPGRAGDM